MQHWAARVSPANLASPPMGADRYFPVEGGDQKAHLQGSLGQVVRRLGKGPPATPAPRPGCSLCQECSLPTHPGWCSEERIQGQHCLC